MSTIAESYLEEQVKTQQRSTIRSNGNCKFVDDKIHRIRTKGH